MSLLASIFMSMVLEKQQIEIGLNRPFWASVFLEIEIRKAADMLIQSGV